MSTLREHVEAIQRYKAEASAGSSHAQRLYASEINLMGTAHLDEIAALLDAVSAPAKCQSFALGPAQQCDHCCLMAIDEPLDCPHAPEGERP